MYNAPRMYPCPYCINTAMYSSNNMYYQPYMYQHPYHANMSMYNPDILKASFIWWIKLPNKAGFNNE